MIFDNLVVEVVGIFKDSVKTPSESRIASMVYRCGGVWKEGVSFLLSKRAKTELRPAVGGSSA
jgi:hypothetical protein